MTPAVLIWQALVVGRGRSAWIMAALQASLYVVKAARVNRIGGYSKIRYTKSHDKTVAPTSDNRRSASLQSRGIFGKGRCPENAWLNVGSRRLMSFWLTVITALIPRCKKKNVILCFPQTDITPNNLVFVLPFQKNPGLLPYVQRLLSKFHNPPQRMKLVNSQFPAPLSQVVFGNASAPYVPIPHDATLYTLQGTDDPLTFWQPGPPAFFL